MTNQTAPEKLQPKDFASDQEVRWCPGCGDYAILKAVHKTLADIGATTEGTVFVSGIGCAARFPYYMATYGFHTIHGRAAAIATGVKLANPDLDIWVVGGDGDSLSIGGNHLMHALRRNIDMNYLLFNNEIYGLTKGQYSPTSRIGTKSPSTPTGSIDTPVNAAAFALGCGARFVARSGDIMQAHLVETLTKAHGHKGMSFVEIMQNCIVYNDGVFGNFMEKKVQKDAQILVEHGKPLRFGAEGQKGLALDIKTLSLKVVTVGEDAGEDDILVHDETNAVLAGLLARMEPPHFPVAMGVLYNNPAAQTYDQEMKAQMAAATTARQGKLEDLLTRGHTWTVG